MSTELIDLPVSLAHHHDMQDQITRLSSLDQAHVWRHRSETDLYFLLRHTLSTALWQHPEKPGEFLFDDPFFFDRCREVQFGPTHCLNIWSRGSGKSTICTFGRTVQRILLNPNRTFGFFSVNATLAQQFMKQIMTEFESNEFLKNLFDDVLYADPKNESDLWALNKGMTVKRSMNMKDPTIAAFGLLDSSFTGSRQSDQIFDDILNEKFVKTPEMSAKVMEKWDLATDLGFPGTVRYYSGTFYGYGDAYYQIAQRGIPISLHPCYEIDEEESTFDQYGLPLKLAYDFDKPVPFSAEYYETKKREKTPKIFGAQYLVNPVYASKQSFDLDWLQYYDTDPKDEARGKNCYILCDPASSRSKGRSYCVFWVVACGGDRNYYVVDGVWDRIDLSQRVDHLFRLHERWNPKEVRYERYALQSDVPHIMHVQKERGYRFPVIEVAGNVPKFDRINRLHPLFRAKRIFFPKPKIEGGQGLMHFSIEQEKEVDLVEIFKTYEYAAFPEITQDDMLDGLSRIEEPDLPIMWPKGHVGQNNVHDRYYEARRRQRHERPQGSWMSV